TTAAMTLSGNPLADYTAIASGFIGSLSNTGAFDEMIDSMRRVPLATGTVGQVNVGATAFSVGEGQMKSITKLSIANQQMNPQKAAGALIISQELARSAVAGSAELIEGMLRDAVGLITDQAFFTTVLNGVNSTTSTGQTAEAVRADISNMLKLMTTGKT